MNSPLVLADKREDRSLTHVNKQRSIPSVDPGDSVSQAKTMRRLAVAEEWNEEVRRTFHRLYVEEDKSLQQVMTEMVELLGFQATYADSVLTTSLLSVLALFVQHMISLSFL